jgi:hypothetical protein
MAKVHAPVFLKSLNGDIYKGVIKKTKSGKLTLSNVHKVGFRKESLPEEGHIKYFVCCEKYFVYTAIGADNVHHASNKATKLFGPHWTHLTHNAGAIWEYSYVKPTDFKLFLANSLQN